MIAERQRRAGELIDQLASLADNLPVWDAEPEDQTVLLAMQDAAADLWDIWREIQVLRDLGGDIPRLSGCKPLPAGKLT